MSQIQKRAFLRHLRAEPTSHVLRYRNGRLVSSKVGASFWFRPLNTSIEVVPTSDRDQNFIFNGRTGDFQDVSVQGTITYRIVDPQLAARRIDFSIDLASGLHLQEPLQRLADVVSLTAQQLALDWIAHRALDEVLRSAIQHLGPLMAAGLSADESLADTGLVVAAMRLTQVRPHPDLQKAMEAPTREHMQQVADEAVFQRRALAVEKERAIAENELHNQVELARQKQQLLEQEGANEKRLAEDESAALLIKAEATATRERLDSETKAEGIRIVGDARNDAERGRIDAHRDVPPQVLLAMGLREFANNLEIVDIDHLSINPDGFGAVLESLMGAGTRALEAADATSAGATQ